MKHLKIKIYKSEDGVYSITNEPITLAPSTRELYEIAHPDVNWDELSRRSEKNRLYRFGKSNLFAELYEQHKKVREFKFIGYVDIDFDGRIREGMIPILVEKALNNGKTEIQYYPQSNANKPPELQMVYVKGFNRSWI